MGMIVPAMGKIYGGAAADGLAAALFTPVQRRLIGLLYGQPGRAFGSGELIRAARSGTGAAHRQLQRLEKAGIIASRRIGNQKQYLANTACPIFPELRGLVVKTFGLVEPLRAALAPLSDRIELAFVFGSVAKGTERAGSDLDLLVVSDDLSYPEVYQVLARAEEVLGRPVNPTVLKCAEWRRKRSARDSFARRIAEQPKLFVIGDEGDLA